MNESPFGLQERFWARLSVADLLRERQRLVAMIMVLVVTNVFGWGLAFWLLIQK